VSGAPAGALSGVVGASRGVRAGAMGLVMVVGVVAFTWPFLVTPGSELAQLGHSGDASLLFVLLMGLLGLVLLAEMSSGTLDAKGVAVLGVLAAAGGALRVLSAGTAGLEPMFFLFVVAGRALGASKGFLLGALALLASAFLTAGIGPWTPFQMLCCGWVAMGAGLLPRCSGWAERLVLAAYGLVSGMVYGAVMNLWFWPFASYGPEVSYVAGDPFGANLSRYLVFYVTTSLPWDVGRAVLSGLVVLLAGSALLRALRRAARRAAFDVPVVFEPQGPR